MAVNSVKEMLIAFIYDLEFCKNEYDDPLGAINYFHPSWVSDAQKLSLSGKIIGMMNFISDFEEEPCIITLQNGKFKCKKFGRFVLALGSDRNIKENLLAHRFKQLCKIISLYHNDFNHIFEQFDDSKNFNDKLYQILETYLPVLTSNVHQNVYKFHLPKSASNIFLNATQILESITNNGDVVLGGMILYNNKVICSQFSTELTKILVATDPFRMKTTAEAVKNVNFHIPSGSQMIKIYITNQEYSQLQLQIKKSKDATLLGVQKLPFSIKKKPKDGPWLKRDKLIFSNIPEEEPELIAEIKQAERTKKRPNTLPIKQLKTIPPESGIASIVSFDESDSYPDFIGKTTVAQTPLMAMTPMIGPISSIFANEDQTKAKFEETNKITEKIKGEKKEWKSIFISYAENPFRSLQFKKKSLSDIFGTIENNNASSKDITSYNPYNTITDPYYPIMCAYKKKPLSKSLFDDYNALFLPPEKLIKTEHKKSEVIKIEEYKMKFENDPMIMKRNDTNSPSRVMRNQKKKLLKLPIKSFSLDIDSSSSNGTNSIFDSPKIKAMGGLQLTPLMSKLTLLAMNENETFSEIQKPNNSMDINNTLFNRSVKVNEEKQETEREYTEMKKVDLFVCGEKNMSIMIVLNDENSIDKLIVQHMFEICINRLSRFEQKLNDLINMAVDLKASDYSFLTLDKNWDVIQRSGNYDLLSTSLMHDHFKEHKKITDIVLRTNDSIIYGHNNAGSEAFYQHPIKMSNCGFPAPSEFAIISSAKRKLERDQSLVLF